MAKIINTTEKKRPPKTQRAVTVGIVVGILVLGAIVGVGVRWWQNKNNKQSSQVSDFERSGGKPLPSAVDESEKLASEGKLDEANKKIEESLASADNDDRHELYIQAGLNYFNEKKYDQSMEQLRKAEAIKADFKVVRLIAEVAQTKGDKQLAIDYYKKAIPLINPDNPMKDAEKRMIETEIDKLEGS